MCFKFPITLRMNSHYSKCVAFTAFAFWQQVPLCECKSDFSICENSVNHHLCNCFLRREAKTRIRQSDWLKLAGEKIRREQVGSVPTFLSVRANKVAKWKIGLRDTGVNWDRNLVHCDPCDCSLMLIQ